MAGLLHDNKGDASSGAYGAKALHVGGFPFLNTAAKFWTCLLDEVVEKYPPDTRVVIAGACSGQLGASLLDPEQLLQRDMRDLESDKAQQVLNDAIGVLELLGPPPGIRLSLVAADGEKILHEMVIEDIDAELMPFLLSWLLEWARVPDTQWNNKSVRGLFTGEDRNRMYSYKIMFELRNTLLGEELYDREVSLRCERTRVRLPVSGS